MKKLVFLLFFLLIVACQKSTLQVPNVNENMLIITHYKQNMLSFIDIESGVLLQSLPMEQWFLDMELIDDEKLLLAGYNEEYLYKLNLSNGKLTQFYQAGKGIQQLEYDRNNEVLFLANNVKNEVQFLDIKEKELDGEIFVGGFISALTYDEANGHLYIANAEDNIILVIDTLTKQMIASFSVIERPAGLLFDGKYLWVGGHGSKGILNKYIYIYDPKTGLEIKRIEAGSMPIEFFDDGKDNYIYTLSHGSSEIFQINKETKEIAAKLKVGANPYGIAGDAAYIYISSLDGNALSIINRKTFAIEKELELEDGPYQLILGGEK